MSADSASTSTATAAVATAPTPSTRKPTLRSLSSTLTDVTAASSASSSSVSAKEVRLAAEKQLQQRTADMNARAKAGTPLTDDELDDVINSLQNVHPTDDGDDEKTAMATDWTALRKLLTQVAHLSHKDWSVTEANSKRLGDVLFRNGLTADRHQVVERVLKEGNWDGAARHATSNGVATVKDDDETKPPDAKKTKKSAPPSWAVLVTGVNGIRKTTSLYQPWFPALLQEALVGPSTSSDGGASATTTTDDVDVNDFPSGSNAFFRQLDHMIATLCNEDFARLYALTADVVATEKDDDDDSPSKEAVQLYSDYKAGIFTRYRTLSELLGAFLLQEAQKDGLSCMMETSGRDIAMFHYVNHFFPSSTNYRKLALHFTINDLTQACDSVDRRMAGEIKAGVKALQAGSAFDIIYTNAGGPYGSDVLAGVQEASDRVWNEVILGSDDKEGNSVSDDWYKATIAITAHSTEPWTAQAVKADGSLSPTKYTFERT